MKALFGFLVTLAFVMIVDGSPLLAGAGRAALAVTALILGGAGNMKGTDMPTICYGCDCCHENAGEGYLYPDRSDLRVMPNGQWLCDGCYWDMDTPDLTGTYGVEPMSYDADGDVDQWPRWDGFPIPPEYVPATGE